MENYRNHMDNKMAHNDSRLALKFKGKNVQRQNEKAFPPYHIKQ